MEMRGFILIGAVAVAAGMASSASDSRLNQEVSAAVGSIRAGDLPREVARLIKAADGSDRQERCIALLSAAVRARPASAPLVVGTASRVAPELAAEFASAATTVEPGQCSGIARAAASSAPERLAEIVAAVLKIKPEFYAQVAYDVAYALPKNRREIARAIMAALPNLRYVVPGSEESAGLSDLLAATTEVDKASKRLGLPPGEFLKAQLSAEQLASANLSMVSPASLSSAQPNIASQTGVSDPHQGPAGGKEGATVLPKSEGEGKRAFTKATTVADAPAAARVTVTPSTGRSYYAPPPPPPFP